MQEFRLIFKERGIKKAARQFLRLVGNTRHFAFYGKMGVGKTTFIKALCQHLKAEDLVSSPTFAIINEYNSEKQGIIYHFDFYRIKSVDELLDIGFHEYCSDDAWCFVEWPEKGEELLTDDFLPVMIEEDDKQNRVLRFDMRVQN